MIFDHRIIVTHITKQHYMILSATTIANELLGHIITKHTKGNQYLRMLLQNIYYLEMQNIEVDANVGLIIYNRKDEPSGV